MKKLLTFSILFLTGCNVEVKNKVEVNFTGQPRLEKYFECSCVKTYTSGNNLYVEVKNSPVIIRKYKADSENYDFLHDAGMASLIVSQFIKGTNIDTFHLEFTFDTAIAKVARSFSYDAVTSMDIAEKIEIAGVFCRTVSDSDFSIAKKYLNPALISELTEKKVDTFLAEFYALGKVTNITLLGYRHNIENNYLGAKFEITFDSGKKGAFLFDYPLKGPAHINGYNLVKE